MREAAKKYLDLAGMLLPGDPTYLVFYVTSLCDSRCKTCFNWKYNNSRHRAEKELSLEEIARFARSTGRLHYVTLGGGEPFLRSDLAEICKIFYDTNHARIFAIPTNCLNPASIAEQTEEILEKCPEAVVRVSISIDGVGQGHDFVRGVPGNFDRLLSTYGLLERLRQRHHRLEILANTTFCSYTQESIGEIHAYVTSNFRLDMYSVTLIRGTVENPEVKDVDLGKYQEAIGLFEKGYFRDRGEARHPLQRLLSILPIFTRREVVRTATAKRRTYTCYAIRKQVVIDSFGGVFACEMLPQQLGSLRESGYDLPAILRTPEASALACSIKRRECNCTWECAIQHSMVFNVRKWPRIFYEAFFRRSLP